MRSITLMAVVLAWSAVDARAQSPAHPRPLPIRPPGAQWALPVMIHDDVPGSAVSLGRAAVGAGWSRLASSGPVPAAPHAAGQESGGPGFAGRAARDLGRGVRDLADDGWAVLTVPTRMDGRDVGVLAGVLGVGGLLYVWDEGLSDAVRRQQGHALHDGVVEVGEFVEPVGLMGNTNRWYVVGVVAGYLSGWDPLLRVSRDLLASHWLAAATYNPPRTWIGRSRPEDGLGPRAFEGGTSLPSGHASSIVQVAAVLSHHVDWTPARIAFWGLAGALLVQRVDSGKHWPSDVWIGAAWGYGVTRLVLARADARRRPREGPSRPAGVGIGPFVDARSGRPGVAVRIPLGGL